MSGLCQRFRIVQAAGPIASRRRSRAVLTRRANALRAVRRFFDARDYLELDAPVLVISPGLEPHLDAFELAVDHPRRYLHTSPEYALKCALGEGLERIYCLGPCFRDEVPSPTHSPEFTMLEWYRVGATLDDLMDETEALVRAVAIVLHAEERASVPFERLSMRDAFTRYAGVDPWQHSDASALRAAGRAAGVAVPTESPAWDDVFFQIFLNAVEPALARGRPCFVHGYPASQAALARLDPDDPTVARRFELYGGGFELANAFDELTDADEQRRRFEFDRESRRSEGRKAPPIDEALLEALGRVPPTCGIALGFDRLMMWLTGTIHIDDVRLQAFGRSEGGGNS